MKTLAARTTRAIPRLLLAAVLVGPAVFVWATEDTSRVERRVNTLAEALALKGLAAGQQVRIEGFDRPGDGGGGRFRMTESGAAPDGGLIFVPESALSGEVVEIANDARSHQLKRVGEGRMLAPGSLTIELLHPENERVLLTLTDREHLHGHAWASRRPLQPLIRYDEGRFDDPRNYLVKFSQHVVKAAGNPRLRLRYRYTTRPLRLERTHDDQGREVGDTLNIHWFGGRTHGQDPNFDNQPVLAWMMNVAKARNAAQPESVTTILLPRREVYEYFGAFEIPDGITLAGGGGTELGETTNDLGHRYRPVRLRAEHTRLRVKEGEVERTLQMLETPDAPNYVRPDAKFAISARVTAISPETNIRKFGLRDLVLDGNIEGNMRLFQRGFVDRDRLEGYMRNAPGMTGVNASNHGGKEIPPGQEVRVENVAVRGYMAAGILGNKHNRWTVRNVRLADSGWNHVIYNASGDYENLTIAGYGWGHTAWYHGAVRNLVVEDLTRNPFLQANDVFGIRGGDYHDAADAGDVPVGSDIDGFYMDLRGVDPMLPFAGLGPHLHIRNGAIVGGRVLFQEGGNGWQKGLYKDNVFENVVMYDTGPGRRGVMGEWNVTESFVRNVVTNQEFAETSPEVGHVLRIQAIRRKHPAWDRRQTVVYDRIIENAPSVFLAQVRTAPDAAGRDAFILNSRFNNQTNSILVAPNNQGKLEFLDAPDKLRVFLANTEFRLFDKHLQNLEILFAIGRFHRCTERNSGRTSEDGGVYEAQGGERTLILPTRLFWEPQLDQYTRFAGEAAAKVSAYRYCDAEGAPLSADKREPYLHVTLTKPLSAGERLEWQAAIRPWDEGVTAPAPPTSDADRP